MTSYLYTFFDKMIKTPGFIYVLLISPIFIGVFPGLYEPTPGVGLLFPSSLIVGAFFATAIFVAIAMGWGLTFNSIKNSSIRVRMISSGYTNKDILLISLIPLMAIIIFTTFYTWIIIAIFMSVGVIPKDADQIYNGTQLIGFSLSNINWGSVIVAWILNVLFGSSITFFAISFIKSESKYTTIMWLYILLLFFFGGTTTPPNIIRGPNAELPLQVISYLIPSSFTNFIMADAFTTGNGINFDWGSTDTLLNLIIPISLMSIITPLAIYNQRKWE